MLLLVTIRYVFLVYNADLIHTMHCNEGVCGSAFFCVIITQVGIIISDMKKGVNNKDFRAFESQPESEQGKSMAVWKQSLHSNLKHGKLWNFEY